MVWSTDTNLQNLLVIVTQHNWLFSAKISWFSGDLFAWFHAVRISEYYMRYTLSIGNLNHRSNWYLRTGWALMTSCPPALNFCIMRNFNLGGHMPTQNIPSCTYDLNRSLWNMCTFLRYHETWFDQMML